MLERKCEKCQRGDAGEVHKCSIEKSQFHCNGCCEKISLGLIAGGTHKNNGSAAFI